MILDRTPYSDTLQLELLTLLYSSQGIAIVSQNVRGTGQSQGNFTLWTTERNDTEDIGNWIVQQSWSNGKIYTFGPSSDGFSAFAIAPNPPSWLNGQYFIWTTANGFPSFFPNGAYHRQLVHSWLTTFLPNETMSLIPLIFRLVGRMQFNPLFPTPSTTTSL